MYNISSTRGPGIGRSAVGNILIHNSTFWTIAASIGARIGSGEGDSGEPVASDLERRLQSHQGLRCGDRLRHDRHSTVASLAVVNGPFTSIATAQGALLITQGTFGVFGGRGAGGVFR
jgi:hypothetical protein